MAARQEPLALGVLQKRRKRRAHAVVAGGLTGAERLPARLAGIAVAPQEATRGLGVPGVEMVCDEIGVELAHARRGEARNPFAEIMQARADAALVRRNRKVGQLGDR